jgi:poly-gamma-glutamate synthesis protein (capsule biosynthesis protein)
MKKYFLALLLLTFFSYLYSEILTKPRNTKILVAGDAMFNWGLRETRKKRGNFSPVDGLTRLFEEVDFRMINLETPVSDSIEDVDSDKAYVFNARVEDLNLLKRIQVDLVFLANNHSMDYGKKGFEDTIKNLKEQNFLFAGMGKNAKEAFSPKRINVRGSEFQVLSVSDIGESRLFATESSPGIAGLNIKRLKSILNENKNTPHLLAIHWGVEYNPFPTKLQIKQAHELIDSGYHVIIGHHPHIPQGVEKYKKGLILYSLGNFIFGSRNQYLNHNLAVILHFKEKDLLLAELVPIYGKFQNQDHLIKEVDCKEAEEFLHEIAVLSEKLDTEIKIKNGRGYIYF